MALSIQMSPGDDLLVGLGDLLSLRVHRMRLNILLLLRLHQMERAISCLGRSLKGGMSFMS
jgi:hypothetical protein